MIIRYSLPTSYIPDEEGGEDQERGQVDCHHGLEEERFEEVGGVDNGQDEDGGEI